jgi:isoleucyl-tRNA synthetase
MTEQRDYSDTLFLPKTDFPMRAGLPQREPEILAFWERINLYQSLRDAGAERNRFVLHDGPPYANGNIHIGHALNKILKDIIVRSKQMVGYDANYVPGWDCHGLPIEWKIEEEYRTKGQDKDTVPVIEFRQQCRAFAQKWLDVQREEFQRLGITGDWQNPYTTMAFDAEAQIAREIMTFAENGLLYRGSKPVMWSVVEKTALAEAEVEYHDYQSDMVWVAFPLNLDVPSLVRRRNSAASEPVQPIGFDPLSFAALQQKEISIVIWTTTPWTLPGNRAISFNKKIAYGLYEVTKTERDFGPQNGSYYILADRLAEAVARQAKITLERREAISAEILAGLTCTHPLSALGYDFTIPLLDGDHVTDDAGTGFVHTAPGHGREDYDVWTKNARALTERGIDTKIPYTVDADGFFAKDAPGFEGRRVITDKGEKGDANESVITALIDAGHLVARGRLKHQYPHSWRSKKPVIFRNTPQWFIAMDERVTTESQGQTLRETALNAIKTVQWVPESSENRITGMIVNRPDWVVSRQRAWGVPICIFVHNQSGDILKDPRVNEAIAEAFAQEGADAWVQEHASTRFLAPFGHHPDDYEQVKDILDVWFDSGCTHAFTLEKRDDLKVCRGNGDKVLYLEGSDQHRGWFHSSLLESCGTRAEAPYDIVLTHGFVLDEKGEKMSKSKGNVVAPQDVIKQSGADILRLWVAASDYADDLRIGPEILKTFNETYRKLRNSLRWMLGNLAHKGDWIVPYAQMPELERYILHRLNEVITQVTKAYETFDMKRVVALLNAFMTGDLSSFYFDIRKDCLYCDAPSSLKRKAALCVIEDCFTACTLMLAPILAFTAEEAWQDYKKQRDAQENQPDSVHEQPFPVPHPDWHDDRLEERWQQIRKARRVVLGALEIERAAKTIGSSLEAAPIVYVRDASLKDILTRVDFAEICITSGMVFNDGDIPSEAFHSEGTGMPLAALFAKAEGHKCARSWRIRADVGQNKAYPDISLRDAQALQEIDNLNALKSKNRGLYSITKV